MIFIRDDITITVHSDFNECSLFCFNHGYMGGANILKFDANIKDRNIDTIQYGIYQ